MLQKLNTPVRYTATLCLIFLFAFSAVWAGNNNSKKREGYSTTDSTSQESTTDSVVQTHNASVVVTPRYKGSGWFEIIDWVVFGEIHDGSLDSYMAEQGILEVEITVEVREELVQRDDGSSFYRLDFTFGPSGCYFDQPLEINIDGKYVAQDTKVWLYDENGEALEGVQSHSGDDQMTFYVPHFSRYSYDAYAY